MRKIRLTILAILCMFASQAKVIYVDKDAEGAGDGSSWKDAFNDLTVAVKSAEIGDQVWVAAGVYYPTMQPNYAVGSADPRFNHFTLKNGVTLFGGFSGDETAIEQRNLTAYKTVLSGDIDENDNVGENGYVTKHSDVVGENSLKLFYFPTGSTIDTSAVLNGFVLAGAVANNDVFPYMGGAAFLCQGGASPKVTNCEFYGNYAKHSGGAIWINESSMIIENCTFSGNYAESHAGAVYFGATSAKLKSCSFKNNSGLYGGAVFVERGDEVSLIENCMFDNNEGRNNGGAISISAAHVLLKNTQFNNNTADEWGGALVFHNNCDVDVVNCIIQNNKAESWGGGIGAHSDNSNLPCEIRLVNCKVQGNKSVNLNGGGFGTLANVNVQIYNSLFSGNNNASTLSGDALCIKGSSNLIMVNVTMVDNNGTNNHQAIRLEGASSVTAKNCIFFEYGGEIDEGTNNTINISNSRSFQYKGINNNIDNGPLFLGETNKTAAHTNGNFGLWGNSPVNNIGLNTILPKDKWDLDNDGDVQETIPYDLNGNPRVFAGVVDYGCYEQQFANSAGNALTVWENQHVTINNDLKLNGTDFTIEMWVFPREGVGMDDSWYNLCGNKFPNVAVEDRAPSLYIFENDRIHYGYGDGANFYSGNTGRVLKTGQWNHIAMTFNNVSNTTTIYANGKKLETLTGGEVIATSLDRINADESFKGFMDEFRVWKKELTLDEIKTNMNKTLSGNESGLELYYSFDQVTGGDIEDQAGNYNGALIWAGLLNSDAIFTPVLKPVTNVGVDNFTINWNAVPNAEEYYIDIATDRSFTNLVKFGEPTNGATSYTVTGLSEGVEYFYKVTCKTNDDEWGRQYWQATTAGAGDFVASASAHTASGFTVTWNPVSGATDYTVDVASDVHFKDLFIASKSTSGAATFDVAGLEQGSKYYYRVTTDNNKTSIIDYAVTSMDIPGNALWFDGIDDYVEINQIAEQGIFDKVTMECWAYVDPTENHGRFLSINTASGGNKYLLSFEANKGYVLYAEGGSITHATSNDFRKGSWVHLAVALDGGGNSSFYMNGELVGTVNGGATPLSSGDLISIGQEYDGSTKSDFFKGAIDEVRIWTAYLDQSTIKANIHKKLAGNETNLLAYYDFDQKSGSVVQEKVSGLNGNIISSPEWNASNAMVTPLVTVDNITDLSVTVNWFAVENATDYKIEVATDINFNNVVQTIASTGAIESYEIKSLKQGTEYYIRIATEKSEWSLTQKVSTLLSPPGNALFFDGVDGRVDIGQIMSGSWDAVTLEGWIKIPDEQNPNAWGRIVSNFTATGGFGICLTKSSDKKNHIRFEFLSTTGYQYVVDSDISVDDNKWHHIAAVYDADKMYIYIDGQLNTELDVTNNVLIAKSSENCGFGNQYDGGNWQPLRGTLDEIRIWNTARPQELLKEFAHKPLAGTESGLVAYYNVDQADGTTFKDEANDFDGTMIGGVSWAESKALITPFTKVATGIESNAFTANWEEVPNASKYFVRVATDKLLSEPIEGLDSVEVSDGLTFKVTGLDENTTYYFGVMSLTDRTSAWSAGRAVKTAGGASGELAANLQGASNYISLNDHLPKIAAKNSGAITGWFKADGSQVSNIFQMWGSSDDYIDISVGNLSGYYPDESFAYRLKRDGTYDLYMWVRKGHDYYADNQWHHFAVITGDGNNRILIDGIEQEVEITDGTRESFVFSTISNASMVHLGKDSDILLDEIAIYNNPITNLEVVERAHTKLTGDEIGLVAYYTFDNSTTTDYSGMNRDGSVVGSISYEKANVTTIPFLHIPRPGVTEANLSWDEVIGATEYKLEVATDKTFQNKIVTGVSVINNAYKVQKLTKDTRYFYKVKSKVNGEWSEYSATKSFYTIPNKALQFDGDDFLTANTILNNVSEQATIECWVKPNGIYAGQGNVIWALNSPNGDANHYVLIYKPELKKLQLWENDPDITVREVFVDLTNQWNHIAVSLRKDEPSFIFINGKMVDEFTGSTDALIANYQFSIGQEWDNSTPSDFFNGEMDEFRIWDIALTQEEVRANMNQSEPEGANEHYIAHYTFDEIASANTIEDLARTNTATLVNNPTLVASSGVINPIVFEATNITPGSFTMNVNQIETAAGLEIEVAYDSTFVPPLAVHESIGKVTEYNVTNLCPGVKYFFRARALYGTDTYSDWGLMDTVTTINEDAIITQFEATEGDYSQNLSLTWECTNNYLITEFEIKRRIAGTENFEYLATVPNTQSYYQYIDTLAEPGTYYEYSIQGLSYCYQNDSEIAFSNVGFNLPALELSKEVNDETKEAYIRLDYAFHPDFCKNVEILQTNTESGIEQTFQEVIDSLVYRDGSVDLCTKYNYQLILKTDNYGEVKSHQKSFTLFEDIVDAIDTLDASKGYFDSKIVLNWKSYKQNLIDEYQISRRKYASSANWAIIDIVDKGSTQAYIDNDVTAGEYYEYLIIGSGTCGEETIYTDSVISVGFRQPEGAISGQVSFKGGNPVADVQLTVDTEEEGDIIGTCLDFDGSDKLMIQPVNSFDFSKGQTVEMWINPNSISNTSTIFENTSLDITIDAESLSAHSGNATATFNLTDAKSPWEINKWNHIAVAVYPDSLHLVINGDTSITAIETTTLDFDTTTVGENYSGLIEELRIWNIARTDSVINRFKGLLLGRDEKGLVCNLRFDEMKGEYAFDHSRSDNEPNKSHATIYGAEWSADIPHITMLSLGAKSEPKGSYIAKGLWFKGSGKSYSITPSLGKHQFEPASRSMLVSENSLIYNDQDFTDISSFAVTGNVKYFGADFPVEGVMISVDGQICVNAEGIPVTTDEDGNFEIEVPIGEHFVSVQKMNHYFSEGYYPPKDENGEVTYELFDNPVSGIQFIDSTFLTVAGRIVGGTVEGDKPVGLGLSKNNLGVCEFTIEAMKGHPIDGTETSITIKTDAETGEYEAKLYPEKFKFVIDASHLIGNDRYEFKAIDDLTAINLSDPLLEQTDTFSETLVEIDGTDTTYIDTTYAYSYFLKRNWIARSIPTIEVLNSNGTDHFGDSTLTVQNADKEDIEFSLFNTDGTNKLDYHVFTKGKFYNTVINVFEEYTNQDDGELDRVPVQDGTVTVINGLATYPAPVEYAIENGQVIYDFIGGFPNPTLDANDPEFSYTKTFEVHSKTGADGTTESKWQEGTKPYRAYVFGGIPTGQNFVTQGPDQLDFILRDPPGTNSYSFFEEGFTVSNSVTNTFDNSASVNNSLEIDLGWEVTTFIGFGAGVINTTEQVANAEAGIGFESSYSGGNTTEQSTTFMQSYSTSDDPLYVGAQGDLFFGHSTNITYGVSNCIGLMPVGTGDEDLGIDVEGYTLGLSKGLNLGLKFGTTFMYTQNHIENYLIPDLEMFYEKVLAEGLTDSAMFYKQQADLWRKTLAENEFQKYTAIKKKNEFEENKNLSFDAGAIYEESMETEVTETSFSSFEFSINETISTELGFEAFGMGSTWKMDSEMSQSTTEESENSETKSTTVGFVLNDGDQGDYFSLDVLKCAYGNGPVFSTLGGQSACPYEAGDKVMYAEYLDQDAPSDFTNDFQLNYPTMQIEVPKISAVNAIISGVPDNSPAVFTLKLANLSEVNADNWFTLELDAASNPYGAKLKIDGAAIVNGVSILVPGGTTLTKTLELEKGSDATNNYENINLILHSQCQFDPTDDIMDIADTLTISASFVPTCTDVEILNIADNWLVNADANDTLPVKIGSYNVNHSKFEKLAFQYKPTADAAFTTLAMFFNDTTDYAAYSGEKYKIEGNDNVFFDWDMKALQDRSYQIRAVSVCTDKSTTESTPLTGILDGQRPEVFGTPSPADGILSPNDEIMITFNEPIEEGLVSYYNIDVQGVLNGAEINHGASISLDGINDYVKTPDGINIKNSSYAIEFWMKKVTGATGTIFSQGISADNTLEIASTETSIIISSGATVVSAENLFDDEQWHHYAVVYDNESNHINLYIDDKMVIDEAFIATESEGNVFIGTSAITENANIAANIHDFRIWRKALSFTDVVKQMNISLVGNEFDLLANWPMDEAEGLKLSEKAHSRTAELHGTWKVEPSSTAYSFNGTDQALMLNTGSIPIGNEMDMTIELWFKGGTQDVLATLFSNGNPADENYNPAKTVNINMTADGRIQFENNNASLFTAVAYNDDNWHHFAFVLNRRGYATIYIDGEKVNSDLSSSFGSMSSAAVCLGAMGYYVNTDYMTANHFNGSIDEVRIWNVARTQEQVNLYKNNRLDGAEIGLKAYLPFENYEEQMGVMVSKPTLNDLSIDPNSSTGENHCGTATEIGANGYTDVSPNIKRKRAKSNVNFDFVINNDQMIITPTDPLAMIEKCILEITVQNIKDKHANKMASPVTWTAYINKNQVVWSEPSFSFEKELDKTISFTATIQNTGGTEEMFTISNLPQWITADITEGSLDPDSELEVEFTINEGVNIGVYNEDIFLQSSSGYDERMTINLDVYKQAPDWTVDETAYKSSMNVIGLLNIAGVISDDKRDKIAVFAGDECRGVCELVYKQNYDSYYAFLVVYGNSKGEALSYRVWDASEGMVYSDLTPVYDFEPNQFFGSVLEPITFEAGNKFDNTITLNKGWNWLSFNLNMEDPSVNTVFADLDLKIGDNVKHAELFTSYDESADMWFGSLEDVSTGKLFRAYVQNGGTLNYMGTKTESKDFPIELVPGWNRIGYIPNVKLSVNEALSGFEPQINDIIKSQYQFAMYDGYEWIGSLIFMEPQKGYMYKSSNTETTSFIYPKSLKSGSEGNGASPADYGIDAGKYEYAMSIVAQLNASEIPDNALIVAYVNGQKRGVASLINLKSFSNYSFITVYGSKAELQNNITFKLQTEDSETELIGLSSFDGNNVDGDLNAPVQLTLKSEQNINSNNNSTECSVQPNPFKNQFEITYSLTSASQVHITITDVLGAEIATLTDNYMDAGNHAVKWDEKHSRAKITSGVYFVHIKTGNEINTIQVIKE